MNKRCQSGPCPTCNECGVIFIPDPKRPDFKLTREPCPDCKGSGRCEINEEFDNKGNLVKREAIPLPEIN